MHERKKEGVVIVMALKQLVQVAANVEEHRGRPMDQKASSGIIFTTLPSSTL